uniref:SET domain-containing protein n=1 Tax=Anopheles atroparvus TaxID=41427 RepID=A0A182J956_ANOAO
MRLLWGGFKAKVRWLPLARNEEIGRFLGATKEILKNTVLFTENPLVIGPKWNLGEYEQRSVVVPCPGDDPETFFEYYRYDALLVLKCLATQIRSTALFDKIINLESHYEARKNTRYYREADERVVSYLFRQFLEPLKQLEREHLSTTYTHSLWGTQLRREHLKTNKYVICKCERCSDSTELGTFLSALRCMGLDGEPCAGFQLPVDPLSDVSDWKCDRCPVHISYDQVNFLMSKIGEEVDDVMGRKSSVKEFEDVIHKLENFLHPNHFHLLTLKHSLVQMYGHFEGYQLSELKDDVLQRKLAMCREMMLIIDILDPQSFRLTLYAGVILLEQQAALIECNRRMQGRPTAGDQICIAENIKRNFDEARQCLNRAKDILKNEMGTLQGKKLLEKVSDALGSIGKQSAITILA